MLKEYIKDIEKALDAEAYYAALSLFFALPDICVKVEKGTTDTHGSDYREWWDKNIGIYQKGTGDMPYINGEAAWQIRCSFLHEGAFNINDTSKFKEDVCKIDKLKLIVEKKKEIEIYSSSSAIKEEFINGICKKKEKEYCFNIRQTLYFLKQAVEETYKKYPKNLHFTKCEIIDYDKISENIKNKELLLND